MTRVRVDLALLPPATFLVDSTVTHDRSRRPALALPRVRCEQKLKKDIPGSPEGQPQIHEKSWPIYGAIQK